MANQSLVRHINERRLLAILRVTGPVPRAELARRLSLTRASVTGMIDDLLARRMVRESRSSDDPATRRDVGRPGVDIAIDPTGAYFLGVEIGVGVLRFALMDLAAGVVETAAQPIDRKSSPEQVIDLIAAKLASLRENRLYRASIRAMVVTVPGLVRRDGHVVNLPILGWKDVNLTPLIADRIDLPCHIENNANATAFGHIYSDPRPHHGVVVYLKLGTGCGGAVIIDDKLLRGGNGLGTEFGHLRIATDGPLCSCGQRGCLETFVNLKALQRYATNKDVDEGATDPDLPAQVAAALVTGDPDAERAVTTLSGHLTDGLVDITSIFDPDEIVLGGAMLPILDAVVARVGPPLNRRMVPGMSMPRLSVSRIGAFECAIGAAALAHHEEFDLSNLDLRT
ncbi:ROK family transcriptional regulator [Devosia sp. 2618]|uniref:ROK family transcriptional regulator n=1 Tax=Devosia sp. 2618 TaxID=3156454 RepID=UPI00339577CF